MSRIRGKNTAPEMLVRRLLHRLGFRFRLHRSDLPGKPDIVLPGRRTAIFVHGCFWHSHGCKIGRPPKTRLEFWTPKLERNVERDRVAELQLREAGWHVITVWQCETCKPDDLGRRLIDQLGSTATINPIDTASTDA